MPLVSSYSLPFMPWQSPPSSPPSLLPFSRAHAELLLLPSRLVFFVSGSRPLSTIGSNGINLGGRFSHISDLGVLARLVKTSGFERLPSEENSAAAAVAIAKDERVGRGTLKNPKTYRVTIQVSHTIQQNSVRHSLMKAY